jgi:Diphosphoinositol pentakisphosphate kinase 2 N-terminal domain
MVENGGHVPSAEASASVTDKKSGMESIAKTSSTEMPRLGSFRVTTTESTAATTSSSRKLLDEIPAAPVSKKQSKKKGHKHTASTQIPFIPAANERTNRAPDAGGEDDDRIRLGICAMDKKARSKPMAEILSRLDEEVFHVVFFGDDAILNKPIEEWPTCHILIAFFSKGFPLEKAMEYVKLRKPFTINNLEMQNTLKDRRRVYDLLEGSGIDVPRHVYLSRDDYVSTGTGDGNGNREQEVVEHDDHIEVCFRCQMQKERICLILCVAVVVLTINFACF